MNQLIPLESEASPTLPASFPRYPYVTGRIPPKSISCGRPMSLLSFLGASLTGTSLLLRGSHGAFSFRKGWPASLHPIPPPPLPIRTDKPAIPPRSISPWSSRRTHSPHTTFWRSRRGRVPVEWKFVGVVEHGHSIRLKLSNVIEGNGNEDHVRLGRQHTSAINHRSRFIRRLRAPASVSSNVAQASRSRPHSQNSFPVKTSIRSELG